MTENQALCVKCKTKREIKDPHTATNTRGRPMLKGTCSTCGTKVAKFLPVKK